MKQPLLLTATMTLLSPAVATADPPTAKVCADAYVDGQVLRNDHKLLEARDQFRACSQSSCKQFMVKDCSAWLDAVEANLAAVVLLAVDEAGNVLAEVKVSIDGAAPRAIDGRSVEVDPGLHAFSFEATDGRKEERSVLVPEGDKGVRVVVTLPRPSIRADELGRKPVVVSSSVPASASAVWVPTARPLAPLKTIGAALAGIGVLGLAAGVFFGIQAVNKKGHAEQTGCDAGGQCPSPTAADELSDAGRAADFSTAFFVLGGAMALSGGILWFISPGRSIGATPVAQSGGAGLVIAGAW
jgi:hypothetical protein